MSKSAKETQTVFLPSMIVFKKAYHLYLFQYAQACRGNESTTSATHGHATIASDCAVQSIGGWPAISDYMVIFIYRNHVL